MIGQFEYETMRWKPWGLVVLLMTMTLSFKAHDTTLQDFRQLQKNLLMAKPDTGKVELLVTVSRYYLKKEGELKHDLDSAILLNKQALDLSKSLNYKSGLGKSLLLESEIYREQGNRQKSWQKATEAIAFFTANHMIEQKAEGYTVLGQHFRNEGEDLDKKISYFQLAIPLYRQAHASEKEATATKELADFYQLKGQYDTSLVLLSKALAIYRSIQFKELQGAYGLLSKGYRIKGNFKLALQYGLMAEKTAGDMGDSSMQLCSIYNQIAVAYYDLKSNANSLRYFQKSLDIALSHKDAAAIRILTENVASLLLRLHRSDEALRILKEVDKQYPTVGISEKISNAYMYLRVYMALNQLSNADKYYKNMLLYYDSTRVTDPGRVYLYQGIITYLQQTGQFEKTYPYLKDYEIYCNSIRNVIRQSQLAYLYFRADSAMGKFPSAIAHLKEHKTLSDSIFNLDKSKQFDALTLQFETEKKDKDIKSLQQQDLLQKSRIHADTIVRYLFIGGFVTLMLFILLLINRSRLKQRATRALEIKQDEINQQNDQLKKLLIEKEWLLKEIHHRVKNNFQIVISLLNTQSSYLENEDALTALKNSQNRMHAMSLIHQKLYQSDNLSAIDMSWYIPELVNFMRDSFGEKRITFNIDTDKVELDVSQAVPLGLILNEAISNTIKYAFPDKERGQVCISLKKVENQDSQYLLTISDNGIGLPEHFNLEDTTSLGMSLMQGLTNQLEGTLTMDNQNGLRLSVLFSKAIPIMDADDHAHAFNTI